MGLVRMMAVSTADNSADASVATLVAARVAARETCHVARASTSGVPTAPSSRVSDPEMEMAVERLRRLRRRGLLTDHELLIAIDRVAGS